MANLDKMRNATNVMFIATADLEVDEFKACLGVLVDYWGAFHNLAPEETFNIFESLAEAQKAVFEAEGKVSL